MTYQQENKKLKRQVSLKNGTINQWCARSEYCLGRGMRGNFGDTGIL
jgi:hypothetical protein